VRYVVQVGTGRYEIITANGDQVYDRSDNGRPTTPYFTRVVAAVFRLEICTRNQGRRDTQLFRSTISEKYCTLHNEQEALLQQKDRATRWQSKCCQLLRKFRNKLNNESITDRSNGVDGCTVHSTPRRPSQIWSTSSTVDMFC